MKLFALLFLVGFASASFYDVLDEAADEIVRDFMIGMENAPSLREALQLTDIQAAEEVENDIKTELGKKLRETLDHILEKIKDAVDHGKTVHQDLMEKFEDVKEKMKDLHLEVGKKAKELLSKIKDKAKDFLRKMLEKLGLDGNKEERSTDELDVLLFEINYRELWKKLKKAVLSKIDKEALKQKIEDLFQKGSEMADRLLDMLKDKGKGYKEKILEFIDRNMGNDEKRSLGESWEKVKDYFKQIKIDIREKYFKFGEWVKEVIGKGLDGAKSRIENLKKIAKEVIEHTKTMGKDIAAEALEFMKPYKDDLGTLYEKAKEALKEILRREDEKLIM